MTIDKDVILDIADKTGKTIVTGVKAGAEYTKEKAPQVGKALKSFGKDLKKIFAEEKVKVKDVGDADVTPFEEAKSEMKEAASELKEAASGAISEIKESKNKPPIVDATVSMEYED